MQIRKETFSFKRYTCWIALIPQGFPLITVTRDYNTLTADVSQVLHIKSIDIRNERTDIQTHLLCCCAGEISTDRKRQFDGPNRLSLVGASNVFNQLQRAAKIDLVGVRAIYDAYRQCGDSRSMGHIQRWRTRFVCALCSDSHHRCIPFYYALHHLVSLSSSSFLRNVVLRLCVQRASLEW